MYIYINKYVCIHIHHLSNSNKHILLTSGGVIILVVTITWECGTTQGKQLQQNPDLTFHEMLVDSWQDPDFMACEDTQLPWAPKTMKNEGFGHLKTQVIYHKKS